METENEIDRQSEKEIDRDRNGDRQSEKEIEIYIRDRE